MGTSTLVVTDEDFFLKQKGLEEEIKGQVLVNLYGFPTDEMLIESQSVFTEKSYLFNIKNVKVL